MADDVDAFETLKRAKGAGPSKGPREGVEVDPTPSAWTFVWVALACLIGPIIFVWLRFGLFQNLATPNVAPVEPRVALPAWATPAGNCATSVTTQGDRVLVEFDSEDYTACVAPHRAQAIAADEPDVADLAALHEVASAKCEAALGDPLIVDPTLLPEDAAVATVTVDAAAFDRGDRNYVCFAYSATEDLPRTVLASKVS